MIEKKHYANDWVFCPSFAVCFKLVFHGLSPNKSKKKKNPAHSLVTGKHIAAASMTRNRLFSGSASVCRFSSAHSVRHNICTKVPAFTAARAHMQRLTLMYAKTHMKDSIQGHFVGVGMALFTGEPLLSPY